MTTNIADVESTNVVPDSNKEGTLNTAFDVHTQSSQPQTFTNTDTETNTSNTCDTEREIIKENNENRSVNKRKWTKACKLEGVESTDEYNEAWNNIRSSSPLFEYMYANRSAFTIPASIRRYSQVSVRTENLTPLMVAVLLNNYNYASELLIYNVGKVDTYKNTALDYAMITHADARIIELLKEFETIRIRGLETL